VRRESCHDGITAFAEVVREAGHLVAGDPGVDEQHPVPASHDDRVVAEQLALVDQDTFGHLGQHTWLLLLVVVNRSSGR
jgi:hypothetical protein